MRVRLWQATVVVAAALALQFLPSLFPLTGASLWVPLSTAITAVFSGHDRSTFANALLLTFEQLCVTWIAGVIIGAAVGLAISGSAFARAAVQPYLIGMYALPLFTAYPILVVIFGFGFWPVVLASFSSGAIAMTVNSSHGMARVRQEYWKIVRTSALRRRDSYFRIYLPAMTPEIFAGIRLAFVFSLLGVITTSYLLGSGGGLGDLLNASYENFDTKLLFGLIITIVVSSALCAGLLTALESLLKRKTGLGRKR
jgi:NitT/TauT family transport system permease protein